MIIELCRLTKDVQCKKVDINGDKRSVMNNSIAIKSGKDLTTYIDITAWGVMAETMAKHLKKGDELLIKGEVRNKKIKVEEKEIAVAYILVSNFEFTHGNKRDKEQAGDNEDDLPFDV